MSRILHHVGSKDFKKTHQRHLDEQRALYLERREKEIQEEKERKKVEEAAKSLKSDWRSTLTESEWYAISGSGPTNSTSQTFAFGDPGSGIETTVSGIGGQDAYSSTVTIDGETYDAPTYNQLALQGYTPLMQMQRRIDPQNVNSKLDASQQFTQNVGADYMMGARVTSTEPQKSFMDAYLEVQEKWAKIIDPLQYELQTKYAGQMAPKDLVDKINSLIAQQDAELEALSKKYASIEPIIPPQPTDDLLDILAKPFAGDAKDVFDYYADTFLQNPTDRPVDVTRMISRQGMNYFKNLVKDLQNNPNLKNMTRIDKETFLNQRYDDDVQKSDKKLPVMPSGIRNITGTRDDTKRDGFNIDSNGNITFTKAYDFDDESDLLAGGGGPIGPAAQWYASTKSNLMKSLESGESPTMNIIIHIPMPKKRKRNRRGRVIESTWERTKKHLKGA